MASDKSDLMRTKELLLKQRSQYFKNNEPGPFVERRKGSKGLRSISDRRSSITPNQTDHSRRATFTDRRQTRYGRRMTDLTVSSKLLDQ